MNTGQIISGIGHTGLIILALVGGAFQSEPLPFEVTEVTAISEEEFAALLAREQSPEAMANVDTPEPPEEGEAPELSSEADIPLDLSQPEVAESVPPDQVPDLSEIVPPVEAEVSDEVPELVAPSEDFAVLAPETSLRPRPREAPRVAPEPVAQPEPDVRIDDIVQPETTPEEAPEVAEEETEATSPEEATTETVTEADEPSSAPTRSLRPRTRPTRTAQPAEETEQDPAQTATDSTAVDDALNEALAETAEPAQPAGPPLTSGEKDALRVAVQRCWNVGSLSTQALETVVVLGVSMNEDGRPNVSSIRLLSATGEAPDQAYETARRAIIRCGANGFNLPIEKFEHWREIEISFNPERMRIR